VGWTYERSRWLLVFALGAVTTLLVVPAWTDVVGPYVSPRRTENVRVRWRRTGNPMNVSGRVCDNGDRPVAGRIVMAHYGSGTAATVTDEEGRFVLTVQSPDLFALRVGVFEEMRFPVLPLYLGDKGYEFRVRLRAPGESMDPSDYAAEGDGVNGGGETNGEVGR